MRHRRLLSGPAWRSPPGLGLCSRRPIPLLRGRRRRSRTRTATPQSRGRPPPGQVRPPSRPGRASPSCPGAFTGCAEGPSWPCIAGPCCRGAGSTLPEVAERHGCRDEATHCVAPQRAAVGLLGKQLLGQIRRSAPPEPCAPLQAAAPPPLLLQPLQTRIGGVQLEGLVEEVGPQCLERVHYCQ